MNRALIVQLTKQDLVDRYAGSVLGGLWSFIQPLLNMLVFILVFSQIMRARLPELAGIHGYSIYLISGLLGWISFSSTLMRTTTVFLDRSSIIKKVRVGLMSFPLSILLSDAVIFAISASFFLIFLLVVEHPLTWYVLWVLPVFCLQQAFAATLGLVLAALCVFYRDIKEAVGVLLQLWFWLTPIVYVVDILPATAVDLMVLNPMYPVINAYHRTVLFGEPPDLAALLPLAVGVVVLRLVGAWMMRRLESDIRDMV
jgi:lipopolysaccharide transport system permease protein